jgi:hypothetical protein
MASVTPTASQWDFYVRCNECEAFTQISWAHYKPAPTFERSEEQLNLLTVEPLD